MSVDTLCGHDGNPSLWHLADMLNWLAGQNGYDPDPPLLETAKATLEVNVAKDARRYAISDRRKLEQLLA